MANYALEIFKGSRLTACACVTCVFSYKGSLLKKDESQSRSFSFGVTFFSSNFPAQSAHGVRNRKWLEVALLKRDIFGQECDRFQVTNLFLYQVYLLATEAATTLEAGGDVARFLQLRTKNPKTKLRLAKKTKINSVIAVHFIVKII